MSDLKKTAHGMMRQVVQMRMQMREMTLDDVPQVVEIVKQNYDAESAKLAMWEMMAALNGTKPQPVYFVAVIDITIIGVIGICDSFMDTRVYEIFWVNVLPDYQKCGVGKKLVMEALLHAVKRNAAMVVLTAKEDVMEFYQHLGFTIMSGVDTDESKDWLMKCRPAWALKMFQGRFGVKSS